MLFSLLIHLVVIRVLLLVETGTEMPRHDTRRASLNSLPDDPGNNPSMLRSANRNDGKVEERVTAVQGRLAVKGKTAAGFSVTAKRARGGSVMAEARVDASGRFLLPLLPPGSYELNLMHEGRILSRIRLEIKAGANIGLEWNPDLSARRTQAEADFSPDPATPDEFWRMVRDPSAGRWRRNLESMLSEAGVSRESIQARRRTEHLWFQLRELGEQVFRRMVFLGDRFFRWLNAAGLC